MSEKPITKNDTKAQLPVSTSTHTFTAGGQKYEILRFKPGIGVSFAQTEAIAEARGRSMLTCDEADKISIEFRDALRPGECTFLQGDSNYALNKFLGEHKLPLAKEADNPSVASYFGRGAPGWRSGEDWFGVYACQARLHLEVVVLKENNTKTAAPQSLLRQTKKKE